MARWRTRGAVGLTAALSLGLLISTTSGFSQADDRLPDVLTCQQFLAADPASVPTTYTVLVPAATSCELTGVALAGDLTVQPGAELSLTTSSVAGSLSAESASRLTLTDVAVAGALTSATAGTVPGPVVDPVPVVDPAAPVPPVVALTRVDVESTIEITGTLGGIVVAGTDLLGTLTVADTTGDLVIASAEQPLPFAATAAGDADLAVDGTDALAAPETAAAQADDAAAAAEVLPPIRTLIGTDLELTRISGAIVVDGTTVTGQVRLQQNGTTPLFGTQALVAGGVHEVRPDPAPTSPDPVLTSPQPAVPAPTDPVVPVVPVDPVDGGNAAPGTTDADPTTEPTDTTDGTDATDGTQAEETAGGTTGPGTDDGTDTVPSTDPAPDGTGSSSTTAGRPGSSSGAPTTSSDAPSTDPVDEDTESPVPSSVGPALPDGLTVDFGATSLVDLGSLRPVNGLLTADGRLSPVSLTDSRTGAPGWSVSAQLTDFTGGSRSIGAANLGWTPKLIDAESGAELGPDVAPGGSTGEGLSVIRRLGSAAPGQGGGTTVLGADLRLQLLEPVDPGTYTATLVITVLS